MHEDLQLAARVHYSFLPERYEDNRLEVMTSLTPKEVLGGDYCSIVPLGEGRFAACICDAVGHGVASALYAARINTFVLTNILQGHDPCDLVSALNEFLCCRLIESGMYASFFVVMLDTGAMEMRYAGAGHPAALHWSAADNRTRWLESHTTLLGIDHPLPVQCSLQTQQISPGDRILLYTDGLIEARNKAGEQFGNDGLSDYVSSHTRESNRDLINGLLETVHKYSHSEFQDDVLCLSVRIK